jgi:hypothetical protein
LSPAVPFIGVIWLLHRQLKNLLAIFIFLILNLVSDSKNNALRQEL